MAPTVEKDIIMERVSSPHGSHAPTVTVPVFTTVIEEPQVQHIIEKKNISVVDRPVVTEIHEQKIYELQRKAEIVHKKQDTITNEIVAPVENEVIDRSQPVQLPKPKATNYSKESTLETTTLPEQVKEVINELTVERHVLPLVTEVHDRTVIKYVDVPVVRTVLHNVIVREVQPVTEIIQQPTPVPAQQIIMNTEVPPLSVQGEITYSMELSPQQHESNIKAKHNNFQSQESPVSDADSSETMKRGDPDMYELEPQEKVDLDQPIITHPSFVPEQPEGDHATFQKPVIEHPIIEQLHNHPEEKIITAPMAKSNRHKKSVSFNSMPPEVFDVKAEYLRKNSPGSSKKQVVQQSHTDQLLHIWDSITSSMSSRFSILFVVVLCISLSIFFSSPLARNPNYYLFKMNMEYLTLRETMSPSNRITGEHSLTASARALNRMLESNAHQPEEGLVQYRKGMRSTTNAVPPLSRFRFSEHTVLNDSLLITDSDNKCVGKGNSDKIALLYLHAGGFISGDAREGIFVYKPLAERSTSCVDMLSLNYKLSPEHSIIDAAQDAYDAFSYLRSLGYDRISVVGSSAGGGLAVTLSARLEGSAHHTFLHSLMLFSPLLDYTLETSKLASNQDVMFNDASVGIMSKYLSYSNNHLKELSPYYGLESMELPPVFLSYSTTERLNEECKSLAKIIEANGNGEVVVNVGLPHISPLFNSFVQESSDIMSRAANFLSK